MSFLIAAATVITASLVVFAYLLFIWWLDRYEREPIWLVFLVFIFGGLFGTSVACVVSLVPMIVLTAIDQTLSQVVTTIVVAPLVEEFTKGAVFLGLILSKHFDNETDGLIYGAAVGLGFACVENLMYFAGAGSVGELVLIASMRTLFTALVHATSSAMLGMAFGYARRRGFKRGVLVVFGGYLLAVANHAAWNGAAVFAGFGTMQELGLSIVFSVGGVLLILGVSGMMFLITQFSLKREHDMLKRYLRLEAQRGVIPAAHVEVIPYWMRRSRSGWLPPNVDKRAYIKAATLLAFRSYQLEDADGSRRVRIESDIAAQRAALRTLLAA